MRRHRGALVVAIVASLAAPGISAQSRDATVPHASQYDLKSSQDGQTYRLSIAAPFTIDPKVAYPVLYVLDGNFFFGSAAYIEAKLTHDGDVTPAVVVGIGYPTDNWDEVRRRRWDDLSPWPLDPAILRLAAPGIAETGGGGAFLRFIDKDVKPFVAARFKVDSSKQTLFGYSLGGLLALQEMFSNPTAFSSYVLSSPVISWNNRKVLADEPAFAMKAKAGAFHLRILVTSAGDEQNPKDPGAVEARMIDNASELAERLAAVNPQNLVVERTIFPGETHNSVGTVSLSRGIRFALSSK
jgi:predicted alpha/beta superfamily hydrolase